MLELTPAPAKMPPGRRAYAIGDIHGCAEQLSALHRSIEQDLKARPTDSAVLIHVGDYVDRGPDTAGVIAMLAAGSPIEGVETVNLIGNGIWSLRQNPDQWELLRKDPSLIPNAIEEILRYENPVQAVGRTVADVERTLPISAIIELIAVGE